MLDQGSLIAAMRAIGYEQQRNLVYKASWGAGEIEHYVYFGKSSTGYLEADFGLKEPIAEAFGIDCAAKYCDHILPSALDFLRQGKSCTMCFNFGRLDKFSFTLWPSIRFADALAPSGAGFIGNFIQKTLRPAIADISTLTSFFECLSTDVEPYPWFATNAAMRAAQVVATGRRLGLLQDDISVLLAPHDRLISSWLPRSAGDQKFSSRWYVQRLFLDWVPRVQ